MLKQASNADRNYKAGRNRGLEGIPIAFKANIDVSDTPTTGGSPILKDNISKTDCTLAYKLK